MRLDYAFLADKVASDNNRRRIVTNPGTYVMARGADTAVHGFLHFRVQANHPDEYGMSFPLRVELHDKNNNLVHIDNQPIQFNQDLQLASLYQTGDVSLTLRVNPAAYYLLIYLAGKLVKTIGFWVQ